MASAQEIVKQQKEYFQSGTTKDLSFRIEQLRKLKSLLKKYEQEIFDALKKDFQKPAFETYGTELGILHTEIDHIVNNLSSWAHPQKVHGSLINFPSSNTIHHQPYGVALVIGAWNYPIQLTLNPVIGAVAAGNCIIAKPSELASHSSSIIADIINTAFDPGYLYIVEGTAERTQELINEPLDYIFFTGSTRVGKLIMQAAAEQLTPVTLELGGKSPAIVDETAELKTTAKRITWGKFVNAGQTCVAPDYLYVHSSIHQELINELTRCIYEFYGDDPSASPDYPRIINEVQFGGGCINDTIAHLGNQNLPFGGVGNSGIGRYHGKASFDLFSHQKSIMKNHLVRYPLALRAV